MEKGLDPSNLGRWAWTRYKGKDNHILRIFVAYRPNPPQGPFTVYAQHNAFFHSIARDICPRRAFLVDLCEAISIAMEAGDHVVLFIDGNSDMKRSDLSKALQQLSLREIILSKQGQDGPATYRHNSTRTSIDGIWMSTGLGYEKCGYFAYNEVVPSDHRCLWVDLSFISAFGHNMPPLVRRQPKRLHCRDPRLVENFICLYHQLARPLQLLNRIKDLESKAHTMSKHAISQEYETLDSLRCEATAFFERHCRKLRTGHVAFSPELRHSRLKIQAWLLLIAKSKKQKVSSRLLTRTLKKALIPQQARTFSLDKLQNHLKDEYKAYYDIKGKAKEPRATALDNLAEALAQKGETSKEKMLKALREREAQCLSARKIRFLQGKLKPSSITMVSTTDKEGNKRDITDQLELEKAILENNKLKFSQSSHTPFYQPPLKDEFGFKGLTSTAQAALAGLYKSDSLDEKMLEVIAQWQIPQAVLELGPLKMELSLDTYTSFWKKAREDTACYKSALSFSTMKAGANDPDIAALDCTMTRLPLQFGFAPKR
jgi:hypothetical protein